MLKTSRFDDVARFEVARTLLGRGRYWTAVYLVDDLLIDTGCAHTAHELMDRLRSRPVTRIVNTHSHEDHIGANALVARTHSGASILAHPLALPVLASPRDAQPLHPYRRVLFGYPDASQGRPLADGAGIETPHHHFEVIYTPGHGADHICLWEPRLGWLFTGDLFVGGQERSLRVDYDIWQIIASLKRLTKLRVERLFPACARVRENASQELEVKIDYLSRLGDQVTDLYARGLPVADIARRVLGGRMLVEWITLGHMSRENLVRAFLKQAD